MFAKLFQKPPQEQRPQQHNVGQGSFTSADLDPKVVLHYGVPSTASILAFDHIQRLLAMGTLDGRIKVIGGDNIEGILFSPKHSSFKNLEFLQNQGFLVSVSNDNEIQVWDLESRQIASALQWESTVTAFSVIYGTSYMYIGSEHGMVYVLKFDSEDRKIMILPYYVPTNVIAEAAGMSLDCVSVVRVLHQPSQGNRLLIAYENGVLVLWDASEDKVVLIRGHKDLELKDKQVASHPNNSEDMLSDNKLDHKEEKEISSICWASNNGSVIAVGYIDGDIMFWDLSTADSSTAQQAQKMSNHVVKLQLSSADRRLPVTVLHWCANRSNNNSGGLLFVYGGDEIGSQEVLTVLSVDWSSGIESLKCSGRINVTLNGSFADMVLLASDYPSDRACNMLYVLTNPGQLHLYDNACLCSLMSQREKNASPSMQYPTVIPTLEPYMTTAKLGVVYADGKSFRALSEIVLAAKQSAAQDQTSTGMKWPLTGGVPDQLFKEDLHVLRMYIAGYQDGSVRIWDATHPALSLVYNIKSEVNGVKIDSASAPVSALDFCPDTLQLAVGNKCGLVCLYGLVGSSDETTMHFVTENENKVQNMHKGKPHCTAVFSLQSSPVCSLKFANLGGKLAVGYECGRVAMLDIKEPSVLFLTNTESSASSPIISLNVKFSNSCGLPNSPQKSISNISDSPGKGLVINTTRDAHIVAIDAASGNLVCNVSMNPKKESNLISMHIIDGTCEPSSGKILSHSPQNADSGSELLQANIQSESTPVEVETATTVESSYFGQILLNSLILLCCENELSLHSLKSVIEGCSKYIRKVNLVNRCCWTTTLKKDGKECGLVVLYQTGDIELRSLPTLEVVGECSLKTILRWSFKTNMEKTICSYSNGQLILVNGNETAFISLLKYDNELWIPESLPCLHDKVLAAAVDATASLSSNQTEEQGSHVPGILVNVVKNFKAGKAEEKENQAVYNYSLLNLEKLFSSPPFLKTSSTEVDKQDAFELDIDEIHIDEPLVVNSPEKSDIDKRDKEKGTDNKGKGTDREKLFEGASTDTKPKQRTAEEIKAKYRKAGDASAAAALAKDKLLERQEKLQMLSQRTEELQSGAEDFASMAKELAKRMENRKWWQI